MIACHLHHDPIDTGCARPRPSTVILCSAELFQAEREQGLLFGEGEGDSSEGDPRGRSLIDLLDTKASSKASSAALVESPSLAARGADEGLLSKRKECEIP